MIQGMVLALVGGEVNFLATFVDFTYVLPLDFCMLTFVKCPTLRNFVQPQLSFSQFSQL